MWPAGAEWVLFVAFILAPAPLSLAFLVRANRNLRSRLRRRDRSLARSLALVDMAEQLAEFGRWRAKPGGAPEWSQGLCRITGFPLGMTPDFETQCEMMPDGGQAFYGALERHKRDRKPFAFEFETLRVDGARRMLRVIVRNEFDDATGRLVEWQGVALDVTDSQRRLETLSREKSEALALAEQSRVLAETDPLTGLANRRRAMEDADMAVLNATRGGDRPVLLMFDIDHFKGVNDCYGHPAGDAVLVRIAELVRGALRSGDVVGRIGGEEFLCVLPNANLALARECAERLRAVIAVGSGVAGVPPVTISVGFAGWRQGDSALALFARADAALYAAKAAGRDCVRLAA